MDYEKKYNEALKDMRAIYPNLKGDAKLAVEHASPELKESEEDENYLGVIVRLVEQVSGWPERAIIEYTNWLKSLRPVSKESLQSHWKPSEELMGCLERVMAFKHSEPEDIKGCKELLEQLKKLGVQEEPEYYQHFDPDC